MFEPRLKRFFVFLNGIEGWFRDQIGVVVIGIPFVLAVWYVLYLLGFVGHFVEGIPQFSHWPGAAAFGLLAFSTLFYVGGLLLLHLSQNAVYAWLSALGGLGFCVLSVWMYRAEVSFGASAVQGFLWFGLIYHWGTILLLFIWWWPLLLCDLFASSKFGSDYCHPVIIRKYTVRKSAEDDAKGSPGDDAAENPSADDVQANEQGADILRIESADEGKPSDEIDTGSA